MTIPWGVLTDESCAAVVLCHGNNAFRENTLENFCAVTDAGKPPKMTVCKANGDKLIGTLIN